MHQVTRQKAKNDGLTRYFTGKPCKYGHISERLVSSKACIECDKAKTQKWKLQNKDRCQSYNKDFYESNKQRILARQQNYRAQNPGVAREYHRQASVVRNARSHAWREENKARASTSYAQYARNHRPELTAKEARRRSAKQLATPAWANHEEIKAVYLEARRLQDLDGVCRHVDHVIPLRGKYVCGLHVHWNLQILTAQENLRKHTKHHEIA